MSQPVTVNFTRPAQLIPTGRTTLYTATGSGQLNIYIANDGSPDVVVYIETDGYISDPIPGDVGINQSITIPFTNYLLIYADNFGYSPALTPSISVSGSVTPPPPTTPTPQQLALPAFLGIDFTQLFGLMMNMMVLMMFMQAMSQMFTAMGRAFGGRGGGF